MSYHKHAFDPERKKAEAAMREREAIKDAAYESYDLVALALAALKNFENDDAHVPAPIWAERNAVVEACEKHIRKIKGGK